MNSPLRLRGTKDVGSSNLKPPFYIIPVKGHSVLLSKWCCLPNTKNYERNPLRLRSCRNFPAVIRDREEKKVIVILSSFLRHFYFQPFSLRSRKNSLAPLHSATERTEKNRRLARSLSQTLSTDSDCENKTGRKVLGSLTQILVHFLREGGKRYGIVPVCS